MYVGVKDYVGLNRCLVISILWFCGFYIFRKPVYLPTKQWIGQCKIEYINNVIVVAQLISAYDFTLNTSCAVLCSKSAFE